MWGFPTWRYGVGLYQADVPKACLGCGELQRLSLEVKLVPYFFETAAGIIETFCSVVELKYRRFPGENRKGLMNVIFLVCLRSFSCQSTRGVWDRFIPCSWLPRAGRWSLLQGCPWRCLRVWQRPGHEVTLLLPALLCRDGDGLWDEEMSPDCGCSGWK